MIFYTNNFRVFRITFRRSPICQAAYPAQLLSPAMLARVNRPGKHSNFFTNNLFAVGSNTPPQAQLAPLRRLELVTLKKIW
jgi:hypothetical protein